MQPHTHTHTPSGHLLLTRLKWTGRANKRRGLDADRKRREEDGEAAGRKRRRRRPDFLSKRHSHHLSDRASFHACRNCPPSTCPPSPFLASLHLLCLSVILLNPSCFGEQSQLLSSLLSCLCRFVFLPPRQATPRWLWARALVWWHTEKALLGGANADRRFTLITCVFIGMSARHVLFSSFATRISASIYTINRYCINKLDL